MARPRKPTGLKLVTGTNRADRANGQEPEPLLLNDLEPPAHLGEASSNVWRELAPRLRQAQILTEADIIAFELLCNSVADYRLARARRGDSFTTTTPKGGEMLDQLLVAEQMIAKRVESLGSRFGMDPASRARLVVNPQGDLFDQPKTGTGPGRFLTPGR